MEKRSYVKPILSGEEFVPQNYIAACGDSGTVYKFTCDAHAGDLYYYPNSDGNIDGDYNGSEKAIYLGDFDPCPASHEAESTNDFYDGYINYYTWGGQKTIKVIVWRGEEGNIGHATTNLDMDTWETAKS